MMTFKETRDFCKERNILEIQIFTAFLVTLKMIDYYSHVTLKPFEEREPGTVEPFAEDRLLDHLSAFNNYLRHYLKNDDITSDQASQLLKLRDLAKKPEILKSGPFWSLEVSKVLD